jgi:pimeloyl-ACP methyl ester carboxylesterase
MSEATAIVLIHGLWLTSLSWERWIKRYEHLGYRVLAPDWPGMDADVDALNADPSSFASLTAEQVVDRFESAVIDLEPPPIVIGHSLGGTITEILLDRGLGAAGVAVAAAPVQKVGEIPLTSVKAAPPALDPFQNGEPVSLTANEFHYAFANTSTREESDALHARYAVPAAVGVVGEHAFARFRPRTANDSRRERRAPLLFIGFGADHVIPPSLVRPERLGSISVTDYVEFPGRPHLPGAPGWEEVADYALAWAVEHTTPQSTRRDDACTRHEKGESS